MPFSENINFLNIFSPQTASRNTLWMELISKSSADSRRSEKIIEGVFLSFSENAILDRANRRKIILDHLSAEKAEVTRRAALRRSSRRVLSHHVWKSIENLLNSNELPLASESVRMGQTWTSPHKWVQNRA